MKRALYFGTIHSLGHYPMPISGKFTDTEIRSIETFIENDTFYDVFKIVVDDNGIVRNINKKHAYFGIRFTIGNSQKYFFGYAVPYSPDDTRGGSKTVILVEDGTKDDIKSLVKSNEFLKEQFNKVWDKYNYKKENRI